MPRRHERGDDDGDQRWWVASCHAHDGKVSLDALRSRVRSYAREATCALPAFSVIAPTQDRNHSIEVLRFSMVDGHPWLAAVEAERDRMNGEPRPVTGANDALDTAEPLGRADVAGDRVPSQQWTSVGDDGATELGHTRIRWWASDLEGLVCAARYAAANDLPRTDAGPLTLRVFGCSARMRKVGGA